MDESENVERLIFFEQYLTKLKSENNDFYHEIIERILSKQLDIPFVEECRKLFVKQKKVKKSGKVFGANLNNYQLGRIQPLVITIRNEIESEGIFRRPGSRQRQRELRELLDKGGTLPSVINVYDAGDLLKAFLRELTTPLLPTEHFRTHMEIAGMQDPHGSSDKGKKIFTMQALLLCMPDVNRRCLRVILSLLYSVARAQDQNKMTAASLATVFLPALLPQVLENGNDTTDRSKMNDHISFLLRHSRKILMPPVEIVHLVQKFYPEVVRNMPPVINVSGKRRVQIRTRTMLDVKDSILNFISPSKKRQTRKETLKSHTLLFRSGSADWSSSPRTLDRQLRSKSEKILYRQSRLVDDDNRDTVSEDGFLNLAFKQTKKSTESIDSSSFSGSSSQSTDTLNNIDILNNRREIKAEDIKLYICDEEVDIAEPEESEHNTRLHFELEDPEETTEDMLLHILEETSNEREYHIASLKKSRKSPGGPRCEGTSRTSVYKDFGRADFDNRVFDDCLDESSLDQPELNIKSVGDLIKSRLKEDIPNDEVKQRELQQHSEMNLSKVPKTELKTESKTEPESQIEPQNEQTKTHSENDEANDDKENIIVEDFSRDSLKRESPNNACLGYKRQKTSHLKEVKMESLPTPVVVTMRGPKLNPKPSFTAGSKSRCSRRERIKRNSSTRMGPLAPMAVSRSSRETII